MADIHIQKFDPNRKRLRNKVETYEEALARGLDRPPTPWEKLKNHLSDLDRRWQSRNRKAGLYDLAVFTRQFATMLNAGVPLVKCFETFTDSNDPTHIAMMQIGVKVEAGHRLSQAMRGMPHVFGPIYCGLVESGEKTGQLVQVLHTLSDDLEKQLTTQKKLIAAFTYPSVLVVAAVACIAWFVTMVLPALEPMFTALHVKLPFATRVLLHAKQLFLSFTLIAVVCSVIGSFFYKILARNEETLRTMHQFLLWVPVFGRLYRTITITRITQSLATMLDVGMTIVPCIQACQSLTSNAYIKHQLNEVKNLVIDGESVAAAAKRVDLFPRTATQLIAVGEESSNLIEMLQFASKVLREDCECEIDRFANNIEPVIMGIMGVVVGFILLGAMLPITQLISQM
jgi:type IV pilus assembly protein PilC